MSHPLDGPRAKHERAIEHVESLNFEVEQFLAREPHRVTVEFEPETGWHVARFQIFEYPPPELGVLAGEAAYNCLSALNHIAWELAGRKLGWRNLAANKTLARGVQFPIATSPSGFQSHAIVHHRYVSKQALAVMEGLQPYNTPHISDARKFGTHPLAILKAIADTDKHRVLPASITQVEFGVGHWRWDKTVADGWVAEDLWPTRRKRWLEDGTRLARIKFDTGNAQAKVRVDRQPPAEIHLSAGRWRFPVSYFETCVIWINIVLDAFEPLFPRAKPLATSPRRHLRAV